MENENINPPGLMLTEKRIYLTLLTNTTPQNQNTVETLLLLVWFSVWRRASTAGASGF